MALPPDTDKQEQINAQKEALRLLSLLPRELRFLLVLSETLRLSFREIAEILDISEEAVGRRLTDTYTILTGSLQPALQAPSASTPAAPTAPTAQAGTQAQLPPPRATPELRDARSSGEHPTHPTEEKAE